MTLRNLFESCKEMNVPFMINSCLNLSASEVEFVLDAPVCDLHFFFDDDQNVNLISVDTLWC